MPYYMRIIPVKCFIYFLVFEFEEVYIVKLLDLLFRLDTHTHTYIYILQMVIAPIEIVKYKKLPKLGKQITV